jgi:hypothetical protein
MLADWKFMIRHIIIKNLFILTQAVVFFLEETSNTIKPITGEKIILQNKYPQNPMIRFTPAMPIIKLREKYNICIVGGNENIYVNGNSDIYACLLL